MKYSVLDPFGYKISAYHNRMPSKQYGNVSSQRRPIRPGFFQTRSVQVTFNDVIFSPTNLFYQTVILIIYDVI